MTNPYNPYFNYMQPQIPRVEPMQQMYRPANVGLQGKIVDSLDVVKAIDFPLDRKY